MNNRFFASPHDVLRKFLHSLIHQWNGNIISPIFLGGFKPSPNIFPQDPTTGTANVGGSVTPRCIVSRSIGRHQEGRCLKRGLHP